MDVNSRNKKAMQIFSEADKIRKITNNRFSVKSQTSTGSYIVEKRQDADVWTCGCKDFMDRLVRHQDKRCKHILACQKLQSSIQEANGIEKVELPKICPRCGSSTIVKNGLRCVKNGSKRQVHACKQCRYRFVLCEDGFSKVSSNPKIITESINLYFSGMSLRSISRHVKIAHGQKISHVAVYKWIGKYMGIIGEYVDSIAPNTGDVWSLDEMVLNVKDTKKIKGFHDWLWTIIDPQTRFVIATEVSKRREVSDAKSIIEKGKKAVLAKPGYVITDSLKSYEKAIREELDERKTAHVKTRSIKDGFQNRPIERYHNEIREKTKTRRGLGNDESAQKFADAHRNYHNFVRPHTGLPGNITPAEAAGIDLNLGDDKIKDLISKGSQKNNFVTHLGKRVDRVSIINETDSIKVVPKDWIEKKTWIEINDILKLSDFNWLSNGKNGCWIKPVVA